MKLYLSIYSIILLILIFPISSKALPISEGDSTKVENVQQNEHKLNSHFGVKKSKRKVFKATTDRGIVEITLLAISPFIVFVPFAWTFALAIFWAWLPLMILIGVLILIQFGLLFSMLYQLANTTRSGGFGPDLRGLGLAIFGGFFFWFSLTGGLTTLIWGLVVALPVLWIIGASLLGLALILLLILLLHPDVN
jgi:hypothetical protein